MRGDDIVFYCSLCGQKIAVQQAHGAAGRPAECPACRRRITVPSPADFAPPSATTESGSPAPAPTPPRPGTKRVIFKKRPPTRTMPSWMQPKDNPPPRGSDPLPAGDWAVCLLGTLCLLLGSLTALLLPRAIFIHVSLFLSALIVALFCISRRQPVFGALLLFSTIAAVQLMVIPLLGPYFDRLRPRSETIVVQAPPVPTSTPEPAGPPPVPDPVKLAAARPPPAAEPRPPVELLPLQDRAEDRPAPPVPEEPAITPPVTGEFADLRVPEALIPTGLTRRAVYPDVAVPKPTLPLTLYSDCSADLPFCASGWMGYADAIELDECWEENPRSGSTCIRMAYNATYYWGGIAWQNPPNNWGDEPGGYDLSDAKELSFWARAENNKTIAEFKVGVRGSAPYADSTVVSSGKRKLTREWKAISVPLKGQNLSRIITGFVCVVEGTEIPPHHLPRRHRVPLIPASPSLPVSALLPAMKAWHDDDRFWKAFKKIIFPKERFEHAPAEVDQILKLLRVKPGAAILDLCCGPGRHAVELAARGFQVTGVDRTRDYLADARKLARRRKVDAEFVLADMRTFRRPRAFDAAINMFTAFGYFKNKADDFRVLKNLHASLRPGGVLLIDVMGKERIAKIYNPRTWHREPDGTIVLEERWLEQDFSWIENIWTLIRGGRAKSFNLSHRLYTAVELGALAQKAGFSRIKAFGSLDGKPYDQDAQRLILVARKQG